MTIQLLRASYSSGFGQSFAVPFPRRGVFYLLEPVPYPILINSRDRSFSATYPINIGMWSNTRLSSSLNYLSWSNFLFRKRHYTHPEHDQSRATRYRGSNKDYRLKFAVSRF